MKILFWATFTFIRLICPERRKCEQNTRLARQGILEEFRTRIWTQTVSPNFSILDVSLFLDLAKIGLAWWALWNLTFNNFFFSDPVKPGVWMSVLEWVRHICANLTDVTLADEDTNSILIMPIGQSKAMWQRKWRNLVANFAKNASGATWWPNFEPIQVVPSGGQICN